MRKVRALKILPGKVGSDDEAALARPILLYVQNIQFESFGVRKFRGRAISIVTPPGRSRDKTDH